MKEQLNKQLGPFKLWQWLVVVIVGVGLGLLIRRRLSTGTDAVAGQGVGRNPSPSSGEVFYGTQGAAPQLNSPDFGTVDALVTEQDRFADELDRIQGDFESELVRLQEQEADQDTWVNSLFTDITERIDATKLPTAPPKPLLPVVEDIKMGDVLETPVQGTVYNLGETSPDTPEQLYVSYVSPAIAGAPSQLVSKPLDRFLATQAKNIERIRANPEWYTAEQRASAGV